MVKPVIAFLLAIALGVAVGYGFFSMEAANTPEPFYEGQWAETSSKGDTYAAKLAVTTDFHDFGEMKAHQEHKLTIGITNEGLAEMMVWFVADPPRTVQTNMPRMQQSRLSQNKVKDLEIVVTPIEAGEDFRKVLILNASDLANSPKQLTLVGQVTGGIVADKQIETFAIDSGSKPIELRIYSFEHADLEIDKIEYSKEEPQDFTTISYAKMDAGELSSREGAKSGQIVTINISPELPRNIRRIKMKLITNAEGYTPIDFIISIAK